MKVSDSKQFKKDLLLVVFSNVIVLLSSIITGFIIPKILGVTEYGFYKIFTLYLGYAPLLHLGFVDGILLQFAGKKFDELDKHCFRTYTKFFMTFQLLMSLFICLIAIIIAPISYRYIIILLALDVLMVNYTAYYQYISQSTMRFKELSIRKILLASFKLILVALLLFINRYVDINVLTANIYISGLVLIDILLTFWYIRTYSDITIGPSTPLSQCRTDISSFFKNGIILTISFQASHIIFSLDRQFVSILFSTETYGVYSFAYNLISIVTTVVGAVSLVLFPRLKQLDTKSIINTFTTSMSSISIVSFSALVGYQPLCLLIKQFLPEYNHSLSYLIIIFPGLALSSCINVIMLTYYKALNAHVKYFKVCCFILFISFLLNYGAYKMFGTPESISIASILTLILWYLSCEYYFIKTYAIRWKKNFVYIVILMTVFYSLSLTESMLLSWLVYSSVFLVLTVLFYRNEVKALFSRITNHK